MPVANFGGPMPHAGAGRISPAFDCVHQDKPDQTANGVKLAHAHVFYFLGDMQKVEAVRQVMTRRQTAQRRSLLFGPGINV
jgi:hypothetical protein